MSTTINFIVELVLPLFLHIIPLYRNLFFYLFYLLFVLFVFCFLFVCRCEVANRFQPYHDILKLTDYRVKDQTPLAFLPAASSWQVTLDRNKSIHTSKVWLLLILPFNPTAIYHGDRQLNYLHRFADTLMLLYWLLAGFNFLCIWGAF